MKQTIISFDSNNARFDWVKVVWLPFLSFLVPCYENKTAIFNFVNNKNLLLFLTKSNKEKRQNVRANLWRPTTLTAWSRSLAPAWLDNQWKGRLGMKHFGAMLYLIRTSQSSLSFKNLKWTLRDDTSSK